MLEKKNKEGKLPRKLKKAAKKMINYYDGIFLCFPKHERHTKAMHRLFYTYQGKGHDYYDFGYGCEDFKRTKKGDMIYSGLRDIRAIEELNWNGKMTLKEHKKLGQIFVYGYNGIIYKNGAWVPKVKPKTYYTKGKLFESNEHYVYVNEYSYEKLKYEVVFKQLITEEEYNDKGSYKELLEKYGYVPSEKD